MNNVVNRGPVWGCAMLAWFVVNPLGAAEAPVGSSHDPLLAGFQSPPPGARPRVWWHWLNGNVTQDGIAKDLAWMKQVGLGGMQNFDANLGTPQIVARRLIYMQPDWQDAFRFATMESEKRGLELAIAASPGWSETGGPWVAPQDAMKKLVWSETTVQGGSPVADPVAKPPMTSGLFGDQPLVDSLAAVGGGDSKAPPSYYADVAVLAFPVTLETVPAMPRATTGSGRVVDASLLRDGRLATSVEVERGTAADPGSLMLSYAQPITVRTVTLSISGAIVPFGSATVSPVLEVREGDAWRRIADLPVDDVPVTASFAPVTGSEFRVRLLPYSGPAKPGLGDAAPGAAQFSLFGNQGAAPNVRVAEFALRETPMVDRFELKAGFAVASDYFALDAAADEVAGVAPSDVQDLTSKLRADGTLDWTPPAGTWRILRLGYSLTGATNHPATPEATGLEVDKYDRDAVRRYLETYLASYRDIVGAQHFGKQGVRALLTDSIEVGPSNWTPRLREQFRRLRGYDPLPWLPALTGTIVGSRRQSDGFLYDFRRTLADLIASEHYATVAQVAHGQGLTLYGEALEDARPVLGDDLAMRAHADVPMAALWSYSRRSGPRPTLIGDMRGAASVAHLYGQNVVAAESLTAANSPWAFAPADLRPMIDLEFASGVNRPVIHTSVHQPLDDKQPGFALAIFGQYFNRHETWAGMARPWVDYIARNGYLLQQGRNVADVAYFYGEEQPITGLYAFAPLRDTPVRHAWDFVNADVLQSLLSVRDGQLVAASGARYRVLYLGGTSRRMTLPTLRRIAALVEAGATVIGTAPESSPSLADDAAQFQTLVRRLWPGGDRATVAKGRVVNSRDIEAALDALGIAPDFTYVKPAADSEFLFVHRQLRDTDLYFLSNRQNRAERIEARFRVTGRVPEIWRADTGRSEAVSYRIEGGATIVPLAFGAEDSLHVVFRRPAKRRAATVATRGFERLGELAGGWDLAFQPGRGAPARAHFAALHSLSDDADLGIRYFSGTAIYTRAFTVPAGRRPGEALWLDLGQVGDVAEVRVNGRDVATLWKAPYRADIGAWLHAGENRLEVRVANLWVNRLIGDAQPGARKITFTTTPTYDADAPLRPSGLIGPVVLGALR